MSKSLLLMFCLLTGLLVLACYKSPDTNREAVSPANTSSPAPAGTPATNTNTSTGQAVGIAECDNFITAYENCVSSKVPEAARAQLRNAVTTWRTEWKKLADNPQTRGTLAAACKTQRDATAAQMKTYGCTF
jgi:hypothetical protein